MSCSTLVLKKTFFPDRFRLPPPHPQNNVENIIWHNSKTIPTLYEGVGGQNVVKNEKSLNLGDCVNDFCPWLYIWQNIWRQASGVDDVTGSFPRFIGQINGGREFREAAISIKFEHFGLSSWVKCYFLLSR